MKNLFLFITFLIICTSTVFATFKEAPEPFSPDFGIDGSISDAASINASKSIVTFSWNKLEATKGEYDFSEIQKAVSKAKSKGIKLILCLTGSTIWNTSAPQSIAEEDTWSRYLPTKESASNLATLIKSIDNNFKNSIYSYIIWDHPDYEGGMLPNFNVKDYFQFIASTINSLGADSNIKIGCGVISSAGGDYSDEMKKDILSVIKKTKLHKKLSFIPMEFAVVEPEKNKNFIKALYSLASSKQKGSTVEYYLFLTSPYKNEDGKKIDQGDVLSRAAIIASAAGVSNIFFSTKYRKIGDTEYGLKSSSGSNRKGIKTLKYLIKYLKDCKYCGQFTVPADKNIILFLFTKDDKTYYLAGWVPSFVVENKDEKEIQVSVIFRYDTKSKSYNYYLFNGKKGTSKVRDDYCVLKLRTSVILAKLDTKEIEIIFGDFGENYIPSNNPGAIWLNDKIKKRAKANPARPGKRRFGSGGRRRR